MYVFKVVNDLPEYDKNELTYLAETYAQIVEALYRFAENNGLNSDDVFQFANQIYDEIQVKDKQIHD